MKKVLCTAVLFMLLLSACATSGNLPNPEGADNRLDYKQNAEPDDKDNNLVFEEGSLEAATSPDPLTLMPEASFDYLTFEETLLEFATDVVIAQYVGSKPFGKKLTEFEFTVSERVLGNAADTIFVYADTYVSAHVFDVSREVDFMPGELTFNSKTNYMLPLIAIGQPHANTHDDGYTFIRNIVIDLDNPSKSVMYSESLTEHSANLDFKKHVSRQEVVSFVADLTKNNPPGRNFIRSESIEDIIDESPYILAVEINDPLRLSHEQSSIDWAATDLYNVTVVRTLKGDVDVGYEFVMIFLADMVLPGEQHIIATGPPAEGFYKFSSRNSLFGMEQLEEIMSMLRHQ